MRNFVNRSQAQPPRLGRASAMLNLLSVSTLWEVLNAPPTMWTYVACSALACALSVASTEAANAPTVLASLIALCGSLLGQFVVANMFFGILLGSNRLVLWFVFGRLRMVELQVPIPCCTPAPAVHPGHRHMLPSLHRPVLRVARANVSVPPSLRVITPPQRLLARHAQRIQHPPFRTPSPPTPSPSRHSGYGSG